MAGLGIWKLSLGPSHSWPLGRTGKVQNRGTRFVTGNYVFETGNMTGILGESLKKRRKDNRLIQKIQLNEIGFVVCRIALITFFEERGHPCLCPIFWQ